MTHAHREFEEGNQRFPLGLRGIAELLLCRLGFAAVPEDGFGEAAGASVVEEIVMPQAVRMSPVPHSGGRVPFAAGGLEVRAVVGEAFADVMEQKVRERMD